MDDMEDGYLYTTILGRGVDGKEGIDVSNAIIPAEKRKCGCICWNAS